MGETCPTCGAAVRVVGDADEGTQHYEPIVVDVTAARRDADAGAMEAARRKWLTEQDYAYLPRSRGYHAECGFAAGWAARAAAPPVGDWALIGALDGAPEKLRLLADWVEECHPLSNDDEAQRDLRRWASAIEAATPPAASGAHREGES